jgi:hypothetical protein
MINDILTTNLGQFLDNLSILVFLNNFLFALIYVSISTLPYYFFSYPTSCPYNNLFSNSNCKENKFGGPTCQFTNKQGGLEVRVQTLKLARLAPFFSGLKSGGA